jgi:hypothetical protein
VYPNTICCRCVSRRHGRWRKNGEARKASRARPAKEKVLRELAAPLHLFTLLPRRVVFSETRMQAVAFLSNRTGAEPCNLRYPSRPARRLSDGLYVPLVGKRKGRSLYYAPALVFSAKCRGYLPSEPHLWNISPAFSMEVTGWASTLQVS